MTTNVVGKGRVVLSLSSDDLEAANSVSWFHTDPLGGEFQFSDLSQQNREDVYSVAIASGSKLRVMKLVELTTSMEFHDVMSGSLLSPRT